MEKIIENKQKNIDQVDEQITEWDIQAFHRITSINLSQQQKEDLVQPVSVYPTQQSVLALHWHPEFIPMDIIVSRIKATFPDMKERLIIPTQHNVLVTLDGYTGVEVDCFSKAFNQKVQLLLHFKEEKIAKADSLKSILAHTFKYRTSQLVEFIDTILNPKYESRLQEAANKVGANNDLIAFIRIHTNKVKTFLDQNESTIPPEMIRNKLLTNYFEALNDLYESHYIDQAARFIRAVKMIVKSYFSTDYFYRTHEIIEEVRSLGGGIIIPHPEQFWPILLADYDVDGYEVWNPQSQRYTRFLIDVVARQNKSRKGKPILITMGDDCHMGQKLKGHGKQNSEKASREVGVQPAWEDTEIQHSLDMAKVNRQSLIEEYKNRLN